MDALSGVGRIKAIWDALLETLERGAALLNLAYAANGRGYLRVDIDQEVRKLLLMAFLSGSNIAVEGMDCCGQLSVIGSVAGCAPRFSKIAVVSKDVDKRHDTEAFIGSCLEGKHDVAFVAEGIANEYRADLLVCPSTRVNSRRIMNFCRTRSSYIIALDRRLDSLLRRGGIEGINSIDLLLTPASSGFVMHELRWLSRAETWHGADMHGEDLLEMKRIGTSKALECKAEDTKVADRYSKSVGEGRDTAWSMLLKSDAP